MIEHVGPWIIPIVLFIVAQTGAFLWWASSITTSMRYITGQLAAMERILTERGDQTIHASEVLHARIDVVEKKVQEVELQCAGCPGRRAK